MFFDSIPLDETHHSDEFLFYLQLKKKTSELNKACEKHYALEQELAFYKIDSKFDSLGLGPQPSHEEVIFCHCESKKL